MRYFALVCTLLIAAHMAGADAWNSSYEGATGVHADITDATQASTIDDHARNHRQHNRLHGEVGHFWGDQDGSSHDNGLHRLGSARCYMQDDPPTTLDDSHSLVTMTDFLNTGRVDNAGAKGMEDAASQSAAAAEDDVGHGRCWIDTNDGNRLYFYHGVAGDNTPVAPGDGWKPAGGTGRNLIFHGSFEGADGGGDPSSILIPYGWTESATGTQTYSYDDTPVTEGAGLAVAVVSDAADDGIQQSLAGLRSSTGYRVSARVYPTTGVCQIVISGDDHTAPVISEVESTGNSAYESLGIDFFTDASATAVTVKLQGESAADDCTWDNIVVEAMAGASNPNSMVFIAEVIDSTTACDDVFTGACADIVTVSVEPPGPGYYAIITGEVGFSTAAADQCLAELEVDSTSLQIRHFNNIASSGGNIQLYIPVSYMTTTPLTAGTKVTYRLNGREITGDACVLSSGASSGHHSLRVMLVSSGR